MLELIGLNLQTSQYMGKAQDKGKELEQVVFKIEECLIRSDPALRGCRAEISTNKTVEVGGTRHEIDVWVRANPGTQFESVHLFECKNWDKPVGKNEIMILAGKRRALKATSAAFIAKRFTKDAYNFAREENIVLHLVTEPRTHGYCAAISGLQLEHAKTEVVFDKRHATVPSFLDRQGTCTLDGREMPIEDAFYLLIDIHLQECERTDPRSKFPGHHAGKTWIYRQFIPKNFVIGGLDVWAISIDIDYSFVVTFPEKKSSFLIEKIGEFHKDEFLTDSPGLENVVLEIISKPNRS